MTLSQKYTLEEFNLPGACKGPHLGSDALLPNGHEEGEDRVAKSTGTGSGQSSSSGNNSSV